MRKSLVIIFLLVSSLILSGCGPEKTPAELPVAEPTLMPTKPIEQTIKERPFVSLVPTTDGHWVNLEVKKIKKGTTGLEYELTYFADVEGSKIERGVSTGGKPVDLKGTTEFSKKVLFGSASCTTGTCKYKYDENVTEGTLILKLVSSSGTEKYETVFRIQKGKEGKEGFTTGDGIFSYTVNGLPANNLYLISSTVGLSVPLPEGKVAKSIPYSVFPPLKISGGVSFKIDGEGLSIMVFDGSKWLNLETSAGNGYLTASSVKSGIFILAK